MSSYPCTRQGWSKYYQKSFNKSCDEQDAVLAMWYDILHLAFEVDKDYVEAKGIYM